MSKEVLVKAIDSTRNEIPLQTDSSGNVKVNVASLAAGEDITNDVTKVEQRYSYQNISTGVGTTVKSAAGYLQLIQVNNAGSAWEIDVYDGTSSAGTSMGKIRSTVVGDKTFNCTFSTGLFIDTVKGTTVGDITIIYR